MGWVSCLEDIIKRLDDGLNGIDDYAAQRAVDRSEMLARELHLQRLVATCKQLRQRLEEYIDLATDPSVGLAYELEFQELHIKDVERKLAQAERQRAEYQQGLIGQRTNHALLQAQISRLEQENQELREKLSRQDKHEKRAEGKHKRMQKLSR